MGTILLINPVFFDSAQAEKKDIAKGTKNSSPLNVKGLLISAGTSFYNYLEGDTVNKVTIIKEPGKKYDKNVELGTSEIWHIDVSFSWDDHNLEADNQEFGFFYLWVLVNNKVTLIERYPDDGYFPHNPLINDDFTLNFDLEIPIFAKEWPCVDEKIEVEVVGILAKIDPGWARVTGPLIEDPIQKRLKVEKDYYSPRIYDGPYVHDDRYRVTKPGGNLDSANYMMDYYIPDMYILAKDKIKENFYVRMPYYYDNLSIPTDNPVKNHPGNFLSSYRGHYEITHTGSKDNPPPKYLEYAFPAIQSNKEWISVYFPWAKKGVFKGDSRNENILVASMNWHKQANHPNGYSTTKITSSTPFIQGKTDVVSWIPSQDKIGHVKGPLTEHTFSAPLPPNEAKNYVKEKFIHNCVFLEYKLKDKVDNDTIIPEEDGRSSYFTPEFDSDYFCSVFDSENNEFFSYCKDEFISSGTTIVNDIEETKPQETFDVSTSVEFNFEEKDEIRFNIYRYDDEEYFYEVQQFNKDDCTVICNIKSNLEVKSNNKPNEKYLVWASNHIGKIIGNSWHLTRDCSNEECSFVTEELIPSDEETEILDIPDWIKTNAGWWSEGQIDDSTFAEGLQYMIQQGIVSIPDLPESTEITEQEIPEWIRNNAGWWADGKITDDDFVGGIKYLIENGIIYVN